MRIYTMIIKKLLKYKIIDYCLSIFLDNINMNLNNNSNENLSIGQYFSYIEFVNYDMRYLYKNCKILEINKLSINSKFDFIMAFSYEKFWYNDSHENNIISNKNKSTTLYIPDKRIRFIK